MSNDQYSIFAELQDMLNEWQKLCIQADKNFTLVESSFKIQDLLGKRSILEKRKSSLPLLQSNKLDMLIEQFNTVIKNIQPNSSKSLEIALQEKNTFSQVLDTKIIAMNNPVLQVVVINKKELIESQVRINCIEQLIEAINNNLIIFDSLDTILETGMKDSEYYSSNTLETIKEEIKSKQDYFDWPNWKEIEIHSTDKSYAYIKENMEAVLQINHLQSKIKNSIEVLSKLQSSK